MANYVLPQVIVFQEFATQPTAALAPLRACIVGEMFDLHRYSDPTEKATIKVANSYDSSGEQSYLWPARAAGTVVDETYTKVFFDAALLQYFNDPSGDSSPIHATSRNRIRATDKVFKTANGSTRSAELLRDVLVGDEVKLVASACGDPVTYRSHVVGLVADIIAAIVDTATSDDNNQTALTLHTTHTQVGGGVNLVNVTSVSGAAYNGLADGNPHESYTVEVIGAAVGNDATTAILKVTSASGNDNQAAVTPAAYGAPTTIGTRGLTATWDNDVGSSSGTGDPNDFLLGQKWAITVSQLFNPPAPASGGEYNGPSNTTYIVTVTRGGKFADSTKPQITVSTTTGIDVSGPTTVSASATAVAIGTQGTTIKFTGAALNKNDRYYVVVEAEANGAVKTLVLANNLPASLQGICEVSGGGSSSSSSGAPPDLDLTLYIKKNMEVPEVAGLSSVNWSQSETEITIEGGIVGYDSTWQSGGVLIALPVIDGIVYVQHRDRNPEWCSSVGTLSDVSAVPATLGTVSPDNPLAYGVYKALLNANGEEVKFVGVCSHSPVTLDDWLTALELLVGRDDVYSLVPLTQELDVLEAFEAHCDAQSLPTNGRWRICWLNLPADQIIPIDIADADGNPLLATITDDPDTSGTQNTLVTVTGGGLLAKGVRATDTVRAIYTTDGTGAVTYSEYVVDELLTDEDLRLVSGPSMPVNVPSKIEIWRTLTKTELATQQATKPGLFADRRAYLVWPDTVGDAGITVPGYFLCAALAGLRSGVLPHQGLTNVEILGFDDLSRSTQFFSANQLNTLAASGYWIVTQDPNTGTVFTRHELSTGNQDDLFQKEQNITTNLDSISFLFLNRMKQYIGRGNVTPTMIDIIRGEILAIVTLLENNIIQKTLGPQVIDATVLELAPHPTLRDRIVARIQLTLPFPLNNIELHLIAV